MIYMYTFISVCMKTMMKLAPPLRDKMTFCYQSYQSGFLPGAERELGLYLIHSTHPAAAAAVSMSCSGLGSLAE